MGFACICNIVDIIFVVAAKQLTALAVHRIGSIDLALLYCTADGLLCCIHNAHHYDLCRSVFWASCYWFVFLMPFLPSKAKNHHKHLKNQLKNSIQFNFLPSNTSICSTKPGYAKKKRFHTFLCGPTLLNRNQTIRLLKGTLSNIMKLTNSFEIGRHQNNPNTQRTEWP